MTRKKVSYTDEPLEATVIRDFLPPPHQLVRKEEQIKVTLPLSKRSVAFFKRQAAAQQVGYQTMIRALVDQYTDHFSG